MLRVAVVFVLSIACAGCGESSPTPPPACSISAQQVEQALRSAPAPVSLDGGVRISACVARAQLDGDLEQVGTTLSGAADDLAPRARRDPVAAVRLGYLIGATESGSAHTNGVAAELTRRITLTGALPGASPAVYGALHRGITAGRESG